MELILSLILVPCLAAGTLLVVRNDRMRDILVVGFAFIIGAIAIMMSVTFMGPEATYLMLPAQWGHTLGMINFVIELIVCAYIIAYGVRYKRPLVLALAAVQLIGALYFEFFLAESAGFTTQIRVDTLSLIMLLIIGIVGSGICVYALGYMKDFQKHEEGKDRRYWFFSIMFAFLSAMFIIVICDNMSWIYGAWEVTTLCSFLLIGFTKTEEAINNAFRQIVMNMLGGVAFQFAIIYLAFNGLSLTFSEFLATGPADVAMIALPVTLIAFAGLTKAAQMPFHTWLLGAMVAPTPTSALLHSSTMVKAGVFILIKLSPLFLMIPIASGMVVLVGGITFAVCSFMAISQSNAKRVLAYSTIANLGLIAACAGVGTPEAVWAGVFLIIFHAVAKSLLFLCVGTAEHHIGSRNIEDMDLLFDRMPHLARYMMLGIMGMFIAPFGMLISKWATLVSFADTGQIVLLLLLGFGSAATFMFWAKWLGKLSGIAAEQKNVEETVYKSEWGAIRLMAILMILCCVGMPVLSHFFVEPYLVETYGAVGSLLGLDNLIIMAVCALFVTAVLIGTLFVKQRGNATVYMAGATMDSDNRLFRNSFGKPSEATARNWYMEGIFGENRLTPMGSVVCSAIMIGAIVLVAFFNMQLPGESLIGHAEVATLVHNPLQLLIGVILFAVLGPVIGCLIAGIDRKVSARMQGRVGPPLLQPYYDVRKLLMKDRVSVNSIDGIYIAAALIFTLLAGGIFFAGGNLLLCIFLITLSALFFIMAAYSSRSPYAEIGAHRETLQVMAYEPMVLFMAVCFYLVTGTFDVAGIFELETPMIVLSIPMFIGLLFVLTIKLRKSPFDLSYSHHAHQELVKGVTTEMSGRTLAMVEVMHWCETVLFLGWVGMFFVTGNVLSIILAVVVVALVFIFEIWIDNNFARVKWQQCLKWSWILAAIVGLINISVLIFMFVW